MRVGFVGWRGMVGSVLLQRMRQEGDFESGFEAEFYTTSQVGEPAPDVGLNAPPLKDAYDLSALQQLDIVVTCQGGDYTKRVFPSLRGAGWNGYWVDAASALRLADDALIVLDPLNRPLIDQAIGRGNPLFRRRELHGQSNADGARWPVSARLGRVGLVDDLPGSIGRGGPADA
jgi:aspartate-semialdehyde dehydrogenase